MRARVGNAVPPPRYQENALDLDDAGPEHRAKFEVGVRLRYLALADVLRQVAAAAEALGIPRAEAVKIADTVRRPGGPLAVQVAEAVADGLAVLGAPASAMFENAGPEIWAALSRVTRGYSRAQLRWVRGARRAMADPGEDERWAVVASGRGCLRRARRAIARGHLDFAQIVSRRGDLVAIIDRRAHGIAVDPRY